MAGVRSRNKSAWLLLSDGARTNHRLRLDMRQFADEDEIDLVIVGCGAGGSVLLQRLARAGWRVAALDAGPFWDPGRRPLTAGSLGASALPQGPVTSLGKPCTWTAGGPAADRHGGRSALTSVTMTDAAPRCGFLLSAAAGRSGRNTTHNSASRPLDHGRLLASGPADAVLDDGAIGELWFHLRGLGPAPAVMMAHGWIGEPSASRPWRRSVSASPGLPVRVNRSVR
jgi:hypothetical protein